MRALVAQGVTFGVVAAVGFSVGWLVARSSASDPLPTAADRRAAIRAVQPDRVERQPSRLAPTESPAFNDVQPQFIDVTRRYGIDFRYERGETGSFWLPETMGGGVAWLDYDGDGMLDLYFVQGRQLPVDATGRLAAVLYRNAGASSWWEVPRGVAPSNSGYGMGAATGDVNNDGFDDLYVTNFGPDTYFRNNGDGTFTSCADVVGLGCPAWGTSAAFADLDGDGDLDLFVANYVRHDPAISCTDPATGKRKYCGPDYYDGEPNVLYENMGSGSFRDVTGRAGTFRTDGKSLGVVIARLDDDIFPDIFVANDLKPNFLFLNRSHEARPTDDHHGGDWVPLRFEETALERGVAVNAEGVREANMGIGCGDVNGDGTLDLYVTHYYMEHDTLWHNLGQGMFADMTKQAGLSVPTLRQLSWGTNFVDFDNDGWLDVFVTSGHINDEDAGSAAYEMPPQLFFNTGGREPRARFVDVSNRAGAYFAGRYVGRGSAAADFNSDGATDLAVTHHHKPATLIENRTRARGRALGLRLIGRASNRSAIGTRVTVECKDQSTGTLRRLVREVIGGGSYLSADSRDLLIGLDAEQVAQSIEIRWPSGEFDTWHDVAADGYWSVREGERPGRFQPFATSSVIPEQ